MGSMQNWHRLCIKDVCESIIDCVNKTAPTVTYPTEFKMIRTTNVKSGWIDLTKVSYVEKGIFERWTRRSIPKKGDVILTREAPLGEVGMLRSDDTIFLGQRLVQYRANPKLLDNKFLLYSFLESDLQSQIKALGSGSTVEHMRVPDAEKLTLRVPPLPTQRKIASILSAYDDLIENNTRRIAILEEMAQSLYREWFVHFRFPGHEKKSLVESALGMIPEGWIVVKLGDALTLQRGFDLPLTERCVGNVPVYAATGFNSTHNLARVKGPGVITGRSGSLGTVIYINEDFWPLNTTLWIKDYQLVTPVFAFYLLNSIDLGSFNSGAAVPTLNRNDVHKIMIVIPPLQLIEQFDSYILPVFKANRSLKQKNANLRQTRDLLLPKLISDEVDVEGLEIAEVEAKAVEV